VISIRSHLGDFEISTRDLHLNASYFAASDGINSIQIFKF
jgi:hypothetical protein